MRQLKCEICDSTNLIKEDGVFVCQSCGVKYSVEEVKRIIGGETVEIQGVVKIDSTEWLNNLRLLARRAKNINNIEDASKYYNDLRVYEPNNWEVVFYSLYFNTMQTTIGNIESAAITMCNGLELVIKLIKTVAKEKQKEVYTEVSDRVITIGTILDSNSHSYFNSLSYNSVAQQEYFARRRAAMALIRKMALYLLDEFNDYITTKDFLSKAKTYIIEEYPDKLNDPVWPPVWKKEPEYKAIFELYDMVDRTIKEREEKKKLERINAYWEEHKEEKEKLEKRLSEINSVLTPLKSEFNLLNNKKTKLSGQKKQKVPAEKESDVLLTKINSLEKEYQTLGIFSGKRKKLIQVEIDSLKSEYESLKGTIKKQCNEMQHKIQDEIRYIDEQLLPLKEQIASLNDEAKNINVELTKER